MELGEARGSIQITSYDEIETVAAGVNTLHWDDSEERAQFIERLKTAEAPLVVVGVESRIALAALEALRTNRDVDAKYRHHSSAMLEDFQAIALAEGRWREILDVEVV